jgi:hypothetical protein
MRKEAIGVKAWKKGSGNDNDWMGLFELNTEGYFKFYKGSHFTL